ncbi:hypothetical protein TKK_0001188 [Trichogramma kaykai]|uniref:Uncharacterized protein n=1 Tax=Trichogramma kaykai TaxID=54128 RepID=A0ABD2WXN0_9HYME
MEIIIENEPNYRPSSASPALNTSYPLRSPTGFAHQQPNVSTNNAFYFATLPRRTPQQQQSQQQSVAPAPTTRRIDKSGLLEVSADMELASLQRRRSLLDSHATLARPRPGLLEVVPEIPDSCPRLSGVSDELLAAAATARSMVERQQHLLGAENDIADSAALLRRAASLVKESKENLGIKEPSARRVKFTDECLGISLDGDTGHKSGLGRRPLSSIPDVIEGHGSTSAAVSAAPTATSSSVKSVGASSSSSSSTATTTTITSSQPEGERAEAEGCEHTTIESAEETRVAYNKSAQDTDGNIQAVHVIILSEQL